MDMLITEQEIQQLIQEAPSAAPGRLSEILLHLSAYSATLGQQLGDIQIFKADRWLDIRRTTTSDKMADRSWDALPEGKHETKLRMELKYIKEMLSSIKTRLRIQRDESFNNY